jgi:hypothetical protein
MQIASYFPHAHMTNLLLTFLWLTFHTHPFFWEKMGVSKSRGGLGFRDLVLFNKALLAKQIWRLYKNPESLVARIYQAKYYSSTNVLDAKIGKRPSLAWRSLLSAK